MNIEVSLLSKEYTPDLRAFVEEKLSGLDKYNERLNSIRAVINKQHDDHTVELVAKVDGVEPMVIEQTADAAHSAVDMATDRMARSLRKQREKVVEGRRR